MKIKRCLAVALLSLSGAGAAVAGPVLTDLTVADYITVGGLDWAWAAPITSQTYGSNTLYQAGFHAGWREATDAEWAGKPLYTDFGGKCAAKYWNTQYTHCDFGDALSQHWLPNNGDSRDLWYVRSLVAEVPEPASLALVGVALALGAVVRKKKAV